MSPSCEHVKAPLAGLLLLQHHGPSHHQVTPTTMRAGNATQSIKDSNDNNCIHLVEIATDSTLSQLRKLGLYTEAFLTNIAHQTDEAESVVEYACAAANVRMYSVGEETEVFPKTFEEATTIGSRWVYKINAENSIGQQRLVPTALEHPSPSQRGTAISAPRSRLWGTSRYQWGCRTLTMGTWATESTTANGAHALTESRMEQWTTRRGEVMKETCRKVSFAAGSAGMKQDESPISAILFVPFSIYLIRPVLWNPLSDEKMADESTPHVDCMNRRLSPRYLTYAYCRSKLDFLLRVG